MAPTQAPNAPERANRRFAGIPHRVHWTGHDLECHVSSGTPKALSPTELRTAVQRLIDAGCVRAPSNVEEVPGGSLFRWNRVGKLTYSWEWPAEGWRAAAITALRALEVLRAQNLTLRALHHGDLFMLGSRPTIANVGALTRWSAEAEARSVEQIERQFARPVACAANGHARIARRFLHADATGLTAGDAAPLIGESYRPTVTITERVAWLEDATIPTQIAEGDYWKGYEGRMTDRRSDEIATKSAVVLGTIERLKPDSVLDMGCNIGLFSQFAANNGATVTGLDGNEHCLNTFFSRASAWSSPATAVVMDVADPSPVRGWADGWSSFAGHRLSSELVLALAVIHHLVLAERMRPQEIRHCFTSLAERWLLLEFVPITAAKPDTWGADFYTLEWVLEVLGAHFILRDSWRHGRRDRVLLLLERRDTRA
jgi:hypothetical protein